MSGIDDLLASARGYLGEGTAAVVPSEAPAVVDEPPVSTEPAGVVEIILPSGIEVYFQAGPKRLYRIRQHPDGETEITEEYEWREVPSATTITKILDKPGLVHWGESGGINGVLELIKRGYVDLDTLKKWSVEMVKDVMKQKKLTAWHLRDKAATRGTSVHKALEAWAMTGDMLDPESFAEEERGYVIGLHKWITESGFVPLKSEVVVASLVHSFAGRFDLMGEMPEKSLVGKYTKAGKEHRKTFPADTYLVDLKTGSGVYDEYHIQVAAYQGICEESGYEKPNRTAILRCSADGHYEFVEGVSDWLAFWFARGLYDELEAIKAAS